MAQSRALRAALLILALASFLFVGLIVLQDFPNSADEYSCIFLAKCLLKGKLYAATDGLSEFFHFTHIGEKDGKWFSLYPPGWPLLLAIGLAIKTPWLINPLLAAATLVILYGIGLKVGDRRSAFLACAWIGSSSFLLLHAGSYFSHMSCLFFLTAFAAAFLRAMDKETDAAGEMFLAGLLLGYAMMTRYLSAIGFGAPFGLYLLYRVFWVRDKNVRMLMAFLAGLAVFNLFQFWFQYQVTGNPFLTPIQYYREHEKLGFSTDYPLTMGLDTALFRAIWYAQWVVPGFWLFIVLAFFLPGKTAWDKVFLAAASLCTLAYILYFSFGGNQYGPRYFFESIGLFGILAAKTFFYWWDKFGSSRARVLLGSFLALGFAVNLWNLAGEMRAMHRYTAERSSLYRKAKQLGLQNSVVFIRDWMGTDWPLAPTDLTRNSPERDDPVLYVRDLGEENALLVSAMPDRKFFVGIYDRSIGAAQLLPWDGTMAGQS